MAKTHLKLQILKFLTGYLQGITVNNGFDHDLAESVYRGKTLFGANDKGPILTILEAPNTDYGIFANEATVRKNEWIVLVQGWADDARNRAGGKVVDDDTWQTDKVYNLLGDVEQRLAMLVAVDDRGQPAYPGVYRMGGLVTDLKLGLSVVRPPEGGVSSRAFFYLPVRVGLAYDLTNPWQKLP